MAWTSPRTWIAGEVLSASLLNTHLRDNLLDLNGTSSAWTSWTPTTANLTLGNGTITALYKQVGKSVIFRINFTLGSTSAVGTGPTFTVPVAEVASSVQTGAGHFNDASVTGGFYSGACRIGAGVILPSSPSGYLTASVPFVWTVSDQIILGGVYEAA